MLLSICVDNYIAFFLICSNMRNLNISKYCNILLFLKQTHLVVVYYYFVMLLNSVY